MLDDAARQFFRDANARRTRTAKRCAHCDAELPQALATQRYCSAACRYRAWYATRQAKRLERPTP